jgi:hypothetical protein
VPVRKEEVLEVRRPRKERGQGKRGYRPPKYQQEAFIRVLTRIWEDPRQPCGKLLAAMIRGMIDVLVSSKEPDMVSPGGLKPCW